MQQNYPQLYYLCSQIKFMPNFNIERSYARRTHKVINGLHDHKGTLIFMTSMGPLDAPTEHMGAHEHE